MAGVGPQQAPSATVPHPTSPPPWPRLPSQVLGHQDPTGFSLSLSISAEPIPARLVQRIQSGQFVEMRELLGDNITLPQHFDSPAGYFPVVLPSSSRPRLWEVISLFSWIYCFLTYLTVLVQDQFTSDCQVSW